MADNIRPACLPQLPGGGFASAWLPLTRARFFPRHFRLEAPADPNRRRVISVAFDRKLAESNKPVTITRVGSFYDQRYGDFDIPPTLLAEMVRNFNARTYGQDIFIDVAHRPEDGAAGKITRLWQDGDRLLGNVDWTPYGRNAISQRGYQYLSAEFIDNYIDNEQKRAHGAVLFGAGLTIRPVIKRLDPVQLAEPVGFHHDLKTQFVKEARNLMNKHLQALIKRLSELGLDQSVIDQIVKGFENVAKTLGEDETALKSLAEQMAETGKILAEAIGAKPATVNLTVQASKPAASETQPATSESKTLTEDDIRRLWADERKREADTLAASTKTLAERKTQFRTLLEASESVKALAEPQRATLLAGEAIITAGFTADQVDALAKQHLQLAEQMAVAAKLAALGWQGKGSMHVEMGSDNSPLKLQEQIDQRMKATAGGQKLKLTAADKLSAGARLILAEFDRVNALRLAEEARLLADGGTTSTLNFGLPVGYVRTVIREALADLRILELVSVRTDPNNGAVTMVPYEERKAGSILNDGIVFEGKEIPRASITQLFDTAYVNQMKLSLKITNEAIHFSQHSIIDWDAYARNVESNGRIIQELVARRLANEMQRAADAYGAVVHTAENIAAQLTGSKSLIKTSAFPIVRPRQVFDLRGNAVGSPENPITVIVNGTTLSAYDGSGTQTAGTYYVVENYNLGFIRLVNQLGVPQTPTASSACTVTYSEAVNLSKFDLKLPASTTLEDHLNGALRVFGARKAALLSDRYILPDFALMSPVLNDTLTNARQFAAEAARAGSNLTGVGDLATIKGITGVGTTAPGIDLGDERILLGQRGTLTYTVVKPFVIGTPFEAVGPNGLPTAEKIAYGEEYNSIHVPKPLYPRFTSMIVYDSDARTVAV
ncbi:MAG: phage protease [Candidatus Competibacter denitrificans]